MRVDEYMGRHGRCAGVSMIDVNIIQQQQTASVVYSARPNNCYRSVAYLTGFPVKLLIEAPDRY